MSSSRGVGCSTHFFVMTAASTTNSNCSFEDLIAALITPFQLSQILLQVWSMKQFAPACSTLQALHPSRTTYVRCQVCGYSSFCLLVLASCNRTRLAPSAHWLIIVVTGKLSNPSSFSIPCTYSRTQESTRLYTRLVFFVTRLFHRCKLGLAKSLLTYPLPSSSFSHASLYELFFLAAPGSTYSLVYIDSFSLSFNLSHSSLPHSLTQESHSFTNLLESLIARVQGKGMSRFPALIPC